MRRVERQRVKVSATLDPELLAVVDQYVVEHSELDRSKVLDEALALWYARQQERAMEAQFAEDDVNPEEWAAWCAIRDAAAARVFGPRSEG